MKKDGFWSAVLTLVGMVVGAGILGLPYVIAHAGFLTGLITIGVVGFVTLLVSLYVGEIIQRTKGKHQLTGLAEVYYGKKGKHFMALFMMITLYGALIAYCIGSGEALAIIFGGSFLPYALGFWFILSFILFFGLKVFERSECILSPIKLVVLMLIGFYLFIRIDLLNLSGFDIAKVYLPFGVTLYAFLGMFSIPEMAEELRDRRLLKKAIITGTVISLIAYLVFTIALVGTLGVNTPEVATTGLGVLGKTALVLINLFVVFALATAFMAVGYAQKSMYQYDYKKKKYFSWFLTVIIPLIFILWKPATFITILGIAGGVGGGLIVIMLIFMHSKAQKVGKKKPSYFLKSYLWLKILLSLIFLIGVINTIYQVFL